MAENKWCWSLADNRLWVREDTGQAYEDFETEEEANAWLHEALLKLVLGIDPLLETDYLTVDDEYQQEILPKLKEQAKEYLKTLEV